jgi:metal-responsive CopG/Arc/MetJ family transcriptional regulator
MSDKENFSFSLDPRLIKFIDHIAKKKFGNRSQVIEEAIRFFVRFQHMQNLDTPDWWNKFYQETFPESN